MSWNGVCAFCFADCSLHNKQQLTFHLIHDNSWQQYWLTIPEAVCTLMCSWWWAEEPPETCRESVEIKNRETLHLFDCNLEMYSWCTDKWMYQEAKGLWITLPKDIFVRGSVCMKFTAVRRAVYRAACNLFKRHCR